MMQTEQKHDVAIPISLLVSATYDNQKKAAVLKFYEPKSQKIILWTDETGHKPYCYSKLEPDELGFLSDREDVLKIDQITRYDLLKDSNIKVSKIIVADPLAIGGTQTDKSLRNIIETWESDIKYYENYLYDMALIVGKYYKIENGKIISQDQEISDEVRLALKSMLWDKLTGNHVVNANEFQKYTS